MKLRILSIIVLLASTYFVSAAEIKPVIPISISNVETHLINNQLIRIIQYDITQEPKIIIERHSRPRNKILERLEITSVNFNDRKLDFYKSAATSFESITVKENNIVIGIYYAYPGKGGGSIDLQCRVQVGKDKLSQPRCKEK